ncbi:MAG: hypothetical protein A3D24_03220 [Candidatus Blackburnbacteria bacterium RIFCSPHIGHO2_02_FULL_39_13]|uniref:Uncharacterized protein n=1 Tax=Candidatus Blackburnbacteria bacterium RIFCSPLOWO2_01_FULL_40_20 TaxID=1797519 RepID=A0A1G1VFI1_9BACT|nr:MAG: hypothetical protein A2694_04520 [Candidatus Blackburnbacteria bacterium RIFCSPHIGHO2_01_FULL_40_17]OGY08839.1 MAG: hypothetical protein A3D24_03220 [Candidatus Blackburnbacteria bacterium RIFCSPHIGHO2_02_FULL_39_13]OGY14213.1 MAG: hypothetical protein A3A77_01905 [Candidatus Blackburnbacteria bacterium RIFCSPLOWO2_01_FULL_40_20]HBL52423.1 hypothetical protein [Candidatus Blackburnbacteria bacterium]
MKILVSIVAMVLALFVGFSSTTSAGGGFPTFHYSSVGSPDASSDPSPYGLWTEDGNSIVVSTGDVSYTDPSGQTFSFVGKGTGEDRASLVVVIGPVAPVNGGNDVVLTLRPRYQWTGVTQNPNGSNLSVGELAQLLNSQVVSLRDPGNHNGKDGGALTGKIDIAVIYGKTGLIRYTYTIYPAQQVVD